MAGETVESGQPRISMWARIAIALLALPPAFVAVLQLGRMHPDEVFQMLQPAHHLAFGQGELSWDWRDGLRNWLVPGFFGQCLKLAAALGIDDPQARRAVIAFTQYVLYALSLGALYRLVRRRLPASLAHAEPWSLAGVTLLALYAPTLQFACRTLSESVSAALLLWGFERADLRPARPRVYVLAGLLIGLAVVARYGSIVFAFAIMVYLLATRRVRDAAFVALGGALAACVLGLLDWRTTGVPFSSLVKYFDFNVFSGKAGREFGQQPWWFLWSWGARALPAWAWAALLVAAYRAIRHKRFTGPIALLAVPSVLYLVALSFPGLKEERFLYPVLVMLIAATAPAWIAELSALPRAVGASLLMLSLASSLSLLAFETRFQPRATEQFRLFVKGVQTGTGVVLTHSGYWGTPSDFFAAGRPWVLCGTPKDGCTRLALRNQRFNRIVTFKEEGAATLRRQGFTILDEQGEYRLWGRD